MAGRRAALERAAENMARLETRRAAVNQFRYLGSALSVLPQLRHMAFRLVVTQGDAEKGFLADDRVAPGGPVAASLLHAEGQAMQYGLLAAPDDSASLEALIEEHGLHVVTLPEASAGAERELAALERDLAAAAAEWRAEKVNAAQFADQWDKKSQLALAYWESERVRRQERPSMAQGTHLFAARGYVKTSDFERVSEEIATRFGGEGTALVACAAPEGEDPPTSLRWNRLVRPAALITKMYGLPSYRGLDPTPAVATIFFIFVGICLGDAMYGVMCIAAMMWLKKRFKGQTHLQDFFNLFVYCGISGVVFGSMTGGFFANFTEKLANAFPALKPIDTFRVETLTLLDPMAKSEVALYIAVGLGILTQFYGLAIRVYRDARRGDWMGAFSDGLLWMGFLGGLIVFGAAKGLGLSENLASFSLALLFLSVLGLILTQGREHKNWILRLLVGAISLYGVVGAYGISAFLSDVISFARLMALGLTGSALGSTFNMLAELLAQAGVFGLAVAVLVFVGGHVMNFALALLGAFVHSARLVMLEFFGRFSESGGYAFAPHGFNHSTVEIQEENRRM